MISQNELQNSFNEFKDYICREILADALEISADPSFSGVPVEVNDVSFIISINKKMN